MQAFKEFIRRAVVIALTSEAKAVLKKYRPKVLLVTGSVGKTTTKDAVYTALSAGTFVRRSEKSYNSDIGVPLTILGVRNGWSNPLRWLKNLAEGFLLICLTAPYPKWLVIEVGADRPGDIRALRWLAPDAVVATRFPDVSVHVEFYESPGAVIEEELAPVWWLGKDGVAVLNADDARASAAATKEGVRRLTYGFSKDASVRAVRLHVNSTRKMPAGLSFEARYEDARAHVSLPGVLGDAHVSAALGGIAAAIAVGVPFAEAAAAFAAYAPPSGRMRLIPGMRGSTVIDDSYNASPAAAEKALASLSDVPRTGKRIAVLADMLELGTFSVDEHRRIGALAAGSADILITCGIRARDIARAALDAGMPAEAVFECDTGADAAARLVALIGEGDVVLIKGSQSMRMEKVVKSVMLEPEKAKELLVRQEGEWLMRP
jgi:UDP-N-acetylmuramoyl-tripeptide--D-alanyl-D-alanine ligase